MLTCILYLSVKKKMSDCPHGQSLTDTRYALVKKDAHLLKTSAIYIFACFFCSLIWCGGKADKAQNL